MLNTSLVSSQLEGYRSLKLIPLVIRYATGTPSVLYNPANEAITLTDTGTGDLAITLTDASLSPLIVLGAAVRPTAALTLGNIISIKGATTTTAVSVVVQDASDGATEVDPVDIHITLLKVVSS
jgi:hypothetical protein